MLRKNYSNFSKISDKYYIKKVDSLKDFSQVKITTFNYGYGGKKTKFKSLKQFFTPLISRTYR